jgi:hypothetical protein
MSPSFRRAIAPLLVIVPSFLCLTRCGGSSLPGPDLGGDDASSASDAIGPTGLGGNDAAPGDDGATGLPASGSDSGAGDDSSSPLPGIDDAGQPVFPDAGGAIEDGGGRTTPPPGTDGGPGQIECGATPCDSASQVCCITRTGRSCVAPTACTAGDDLACSGTNSCASGICCEEATGGTAVRSKCEATCPRGAVQLCTTNADCTGADEYCRRVGADYGACVKRATTADAGASDAGRD